MKISDKIATNLPESKAKHQRGRRNKREQVQEYKQLREARRGTQGETLPKKVRETSAELSNSVARRNA